MVKSNFIIRILQGQATLYLVCFDHGLQYISYLDDRSSPNLSPGTICSRNPVRNRENPTQIIRGMAPFRCKPAVIVVKPSNHGTDVECTVNGI